MGAPTLEPTRPPPSLTQAGKKKGRKERRNTGGALHSRGRRVEEITSIELEVRP